MKSYPIIALEGLSGTGKTTIGKLLAQKTGGMYFHIKDNNPILFARKYFDKMPHAISFFYYILLFSLAFNRALKLSRYSTVYMDRSVAWIYSQYKLTNLPDFFYKLIPRYLFSNINCVLYFSVDEAERSRRIKLRINANNASKNDAQSIEIGKETDKIYREFLTEKTYHIETSNKNPDQIASLIIKKLKLKSKS